MKNLKFDLVVNANALLCPNPTEWYAKAYIDEDTIANYRVVSGVKDKTKISTFLFDNVLKAKSCSWSSVTANLDAIDVSVDSLDAMIEVCQYDVEESFYSTKLGKGSNADFTPNDLMSHFYEAFSKEINEEIQILRWKGDKAGATSTFLDRVDGYEVKMLADLDIIPVTGTAITSLNVLAELSKIKLAAPKAVIRKKADLRFYVSTNIMEAFEFAAASGNTAAYITETLGQKFLGIQIVVCPGMSDNTAVLALKNDLLYICDGEGDADSINTVDMRATTNEPNIRSKASLKVGFFYTNPEQIVFYSPLAS